MHCAVTVTHVPPPTPTAHELSCRDNLDWSAAPAIQEMPVVSAICEPAEGAEISTYDGEVSA
jgi:hypothetical protein